MSDMNSPAGIAVLNAPGGPDKFFGGSCAKRLLMGGPAALRTNTTLLYDEWKAFDNVITMIARERLVLAGELMARGLTYPLPNALGILQLVWQTSGDMNPAEVTMTGLPEADKDFVPFGINSMPIPMIHKEFKLDLRTLSVTRRGGMPLDTTMAEIAMRKIAEMVDSIIMNGMSIGANLGAIYGMINHPNRSTGSVSAPWLTATGGQIVSDVIAMQNIAFTKNMFGPYIIFVPTGVYNAMMEDYKAMGDLTIMQRILEIPGVEGIMPTNRMTGTNVLMVQMTSDVVQLIDGIQPTMVEWEERGGFELNFMVFCIMLPRVRADYLGQSGIVQFS